MPRMKLSDIFKKISYQETAPLKYIPGEGSSGGFPVTSKATLDMRPNTIVVVKNPHSSNWEKMNKVIEIFVQEVVELSRMTHPNTVRFYGILPGNENGIVLIAWQKTLEKILSYGEISENKLVSVFQQLLQGLTYLHTHSAHGDLNPSNVLFDYDTGAIALADFGSTKKKIDTFDIDVGHNTITAAPEVTLRILAAKKKNPHHQLVQDTQHLFFIDNLKDTLQWCSADIWSFAVTISLCAEIDDDFFKMPDDEFLKEILSRKDGLVFYENPKKPFTHLLLPLIQSCFKLNPNERPTANKLQDEFMILLEEENILKNKVKIFFKQVAAIFLEENILKKLKINITKENLEWIISFSGYGLDLENLTKELQQFDFFDSVGDSEVNKGKPLIITSFFHEMKTLKDPSYLLMLIHASHIKMKFSTFSKRNHFDVELEFLQFQWLIAITINQPEVLKSMHGLLTQSCPNLIHHLTCTKLDDHRSKITFMPSLWVDFRHKEIEDGFNELFDKDDMGNGILRPFHRK